MAVFDTMKEVFHHVGFDNLYISVTFCWAPFNHPLKTLVHGVTWKGGRGILSYVQQQEEKNRKAVDLVWGTVNVAKLEGDPGCPYLIASSVYDTKPVALS